MQNSSFSHEFFNAHIISILSYIDAEGSNLSSCKIVSANLSILNDLNVKLDVTSSEKLSSFLQRYLRNIQDCQSLYIFDLNELQRLIISVLNLQERREKLKIIESGLNHSLDIGETYIDKLGDAACRNYLLHHLQLVDIFLIYIGKNELNEVISEELKSRFNKFFIRLFMKETRYFLSRTLSLFLIYLKVTDDWILFRDSLIKIVDRCLSNDDFAEVFIIVLSFFIDSSIEALKLINILEGKNFWTALQKCYANGKCERKHVNHVMKFCTSNLSSEVVEGVWNPQHSTNYESWWKKYFIITEILVEKQTHLILPVFSMISDLLEDSFVQVDGLWILFLLQSALEHDSRTIRVKALVLFLKTKHDLYQGIDFRILLGLFMNTVNDSALYRKLLKSNEFDNFEDAVLTWINFFSSNEDIHFFEVLFLTLCEVKWSPIPLYYILDFFRKCKIRPWLEMNVVQQLKDTISSVSRYHHIVIRAAIQCLFIDFVTMICRCKPEELTYLFDFISCFNEEECLFRGVYSWSILTEYLITSANFDAAEKFIAEKILLQIDCDKRSLSRVLLPLARDVLLLHDSFRVLDRNNSLYIRVENMIMSFSTALQNVYLSTRIQDNYLLFIAGMYDTVRNDSKIESSCSTIPEIVRIIEKNSIFIFSYIIQRMMKSENNVELLDFYESCLRKLNGCIKSFLKNANSTSLLNDWWSKSLMNWRARKHISTYCCTKILFWIFGIAEANLVLSRIKNVDDIYVVLKSFVDGQQPSFQNMNYSTSHMASNYASTMWKVFELSLKVDHLSFFKHFEIATVFDFVLNSLDCIRKENLFLVLKTLKHFLSIDKTLKFEGMVGQLIDDCWKRVEEIHSTPYYNNCLKLWTETFFQKSILLMPIYHIKIEKYINILLDLVAENGGQSFRYIIFVLNKLECVENLFLLFPHACDLITKIYCVTHADRMDQRMEYKTEEHIHSRKNEVSVNQIKKFNVDYSSEIMRLKALNIILTPSKTMEDCVFVYFRFVQSLIDVEKNSRKRYFNDSVIHRIKHKKMQLLLIIETIAFENIFCSNLKAELPNVLYDFAVNCLLIEPHQPSVRYMLEWLIIRIILHYPTSFFEKFWDSFSEATEERIGSICSFISVAFHVSNVSKNEVFVNQAVKFILPWAMGQHFNARLYAQTVLVKLINMSDTLKNKYEGVEESLNNCLKKGNAVQNSIKLQQDFYFCIFHPINHFSLLMILWDLPRLSGICREEWLPKQLYEKYLFVENGAVPFYHEPTVFSSLTSSQWIAKATSTFNCAELEISSDVPVSRVNPTETQKKFTPVGSISTVHKPSSLPTCTRKLIVVASLIDRAPNLGGLTRTCEIFAVSQLVINNFDIIRNKEFTSLSITAEKHVDIVEVKRQNLHDYLKKLKEEDFCIVGAEQTTSSKKLEKFVFPSKSVIVLGNEKEGIPASLLPFLDVCVEIPQSGVIRSLNVHVSASILIWEYAKQHLF